MGLIIIGVVLVMCIFIAILVAVFKLSKEDIKLQVAATCAGKNELDQAIIKIYFTFSIGKLASRKKEILGTIDWSEGWMPVCYNLKEQGVFKEERLLVSQGEDSYATFEFDATNAVDEQGQGEGYVVLVLENPTNVTSFRAGIVLAVTANMVTYQLSESTSWNNEFVINH
ncbi:hypothetical protein [Lysinibacillus sphaericus]|uniref:Uncharacterized protein n=1 Tax=Lysinibacillus sphaericus OT4b.31 TaxID=1285586 RepID=R7ZF91_LYSSH|nr:hypothetical protein [Lysinibacillus sphaericus]EON72701.1 hypothetical protein H131_11188 [Lysinibacillus sphaericus OT4b.31]